MKKNYLHIDEIRFLIIHFILINHSALSFDIVPHKVNQALTYYMFEMTSPILAILSGYLFFHGSAEHFGYREKVKRRIPSLIVPYLIWSLGFYFIYFGVKEFASSRLHLHFWYVDVRPLSVGALLNSLWHPVLINFWYLQNLILIIPFNILFYYILKNKTASVAFFAAILVVYAYRLAPLYFEPRFLPFYLMGCYAGYHKLSVPRMRFPFPAPLLRRPILVSVFWVPLMLVLAVKAGFWEYNGLLVIAAKIAVVLFIVISTWNLIDAHPDSRLVRYLKKYKPYSFFLFAIHTFIFSAVQRPLIKMAGSALESQYFTLGFSLVSSVVVLVICLAMAVLLKRYFPRFFGVITGR